MISGVAWGAGYSLRFNGNGTGDIDRVKIQIDPQVAADIGATDFTVEFWMKAAPGENAAVGCVPGNDNWITGNIIVDRDVFGPGDFGDFGISLFDTGIAFGVNNGTTGAGICGSTNVANGIWHHVAATRRLSDGRLQLYVDGVLDAQAATGPTGNLSYDDGRPTVYPNDPYLVIGAEKHDAGPLYPSFHGWLDELRLSTSLRYTSNFTRPSAPFTNDGNTAALYHFDEGSGNNISDSSGGGSNGIRSYGGTPAGPAWSPDKAPIGPFTFSLQNVISGSQVVAITNAGDGSGRLFIIQRTGQIMLWDGSMLSTFMDIDPIVNSGGQEQGLLSVAFHPDFPNTPNFYVFYTANSTGSLRISRFLLQDADHGNPGSELNLLTIPHPGQSNHNGGQLQFGPDDLLYIGTGDGGGSDDPDGNGQNINVLLGKLLRLDVDLAAPYIPSTNPFFGAIPGADAIWDYGLRNPWRFSFDRITGDLFIADVGQGAREEVDFEPAGGAGAVNYGWDIMEGNICHEPAMGCNQTGLMLPILTYNHGSGDCSISGGYRYRGTQVPQLYGSYFYGDYCSGRIWRAVQSGTGSWSTSVILDTALNVSTFGEDESGGLYAGDLSGAVSSISGTNANLSVRKTDSPDPVDAGSQLTYNITVTNNGPNNSTGVQFIDTLPAAVNFVSSSSGGCAHNSGIVTCSIGSLANGADSSFNIVVATTTAGPITNQAIVSANENDPNAADNFVSEDTQVNPPASGTDLAVAQTDAPDPVLLGDDVSYTVTVSNGGPADATGVVLTDTLPFLSTFVSAPGCIENSGTVTCSVGDLNNGANTQFVITVTTGDIGQGTNTAAVSGNESDPNPANNSDSEDTQVNDVCLFCDDFNDGTLANDWTYDKGVWDEGAGVLTGTFSRRATAIAAPVFGGCSDCSVQAVVQTSGGPGNRLWLLAWYADKKNMLELMMNEQSDRWTLRQRVGGRVVGKVKFDMAIDPDVSYGVQINFTGTAFDLLIDGDTAVTLPATGTPTGTVGFKVKSGTGTFGEISVN